MTAIRMDSGMNQSGPSEARYANQLRAGYNRDEFLLDLGQSFDGRESFFWRIVCTPSIAVEFARVLERSLADYRLEYGRIPDTEGL